jgi:hypothetical protein
MYVTVLFFSEGVKPGRINLLAKQFQRALLTKFITGAAHARSNIRDFAMGKITASDSSFASAI